MLQKTSDISSPLRSGLLIDVLRNSPHKLYLAAFSRIGFVSQDPSTPRYGLGVRPVHIGLAAISQLDIVAGERLRNGRAFRDKFDAVGMSYDLGDIGPTIIRKLQLQAGNAKYVARVAHCPYSGRRPAILSGIWS